MKPKRGFQKSKKSSHLVRKLFLALGIIIFVVIISSYFINSNNRINSENGSKAKYLFQNLGLSILQTIEDNPGSITGAETFEIQGDLTIQDTAITNCTPLNTANTIYTLQNNVNSNMTCFTITASNVTLDGNGKTITYGINGSNFGYGVYSFQQSLITVRNAILMEGNTTGNSKHAIVYEQVTNGTIINNNITLMGGFSTGIKLDSSSSWPKNNVTSNIITTNGSSSVGISLINTANYNIITLNTIVNTGSSGYGVYLFSSSSSNLVTLNNITTGGSSTHGIRAQSSANSNNITSNLINILDNNAYGIDIMTTSNLVTSNNITTNGTSAYGISLRSNFNNVSYNSITTTGYGAEAIYVYSNANSNLIASNNVVTSGENGWGIALSSAFNNNITSNTFTTSGVGAYGLYLAISNNTRFGLNTLNISNAVRLWVHSLSNYTYFINNSITVRNYTFNDIRFETNQMDGYWLVDQYLENYTFNGLGGKINVQNSQSGELSYLQSVNGTGKNFSSDIRILNNSVYVNSGQAGLNKSASVSLYNLPTNFVAPIILKDGVACPSSICANLTSLNAGNVTFNVTGWSNYSIAEDPTALTACATLNTVNTAYTLQSNVNSSGTCFNITANNITLNGNGKTITFGINGSSNSYGIFVRGNRTTIQNINLLEGNTPIKKYAIFYNNSINGSILNNNITMSSALSSGIYFNKAKNITIASNNITITGAQSYGIYFNSDSDSNNLTSNIINATEPTSTADGISFKSGSDQNTLTSNIIFAGGNGISVSNSNSNTFLSNSVVMAGSGAGILFTNSNSSSINSNNFTAGGEFANGVTMTSSKSNALASNLLTVFGSGGYGISLTSAGSNNFTSNILNVSLGDRIAISSSNNNIFTNNSILSRNYSYYDFNFLTAGINGTWLIDQYIENYTFTGVGGKINVKNSQFGEIVFLQVVTGTGNNFSNNIKILNNSVYVNSGQAGLNKSANITLYNLPTNFANPIILKDGSTCPGSICTNLTSLNAGNVTLNVTGWSNYSIGETDTFPAWSNNVANILIFYSSDVSSPFNVTWQDNIGISTVFFESNFTGVPINYTMNNISGPITNRVFNYSAIFPAGGFYWKSYANDTANQWNSTDSWSFTIAQASSSINLTLNNSKTNFTINSANNITINCTRINGEDNILLYNNGNLINNGSSPLSNLTLFNSSGIYNLSCVYPNTQNYSSSIDTLWITASIDNPPTTALISPASGYSDSSVSDSTSTYNINFSCNATDDLQLKNISLYLTNQNNQLFDLNQSTRISRTSNSSSWNLTLSQGTYTWNCLTYDNNSQSSFASSNRSLTLSYTASSSSSSGGGGETPSAPASEPSTPPTNPAPTTEPATPTLTEPERTEETATTDEVQTALDRGELTVEITSRPTETTEREATESEVEEALAGRAMGTAPSEPSIETRPAYRQQTIDVVLENRGDKTINLVGRIKSEPIPLENRAEIEKRIREIIIGRDRMALTETEIIEKVQTETETIGLIEQENVQYLARQKTKSYLSDPEGIRITGNHILGNLLRTELVSSGNITIAAGEKIEKAVELNPGISAKQKPIEIEFLSGDQVVLEKEFYSEKPIVSTTIDFDPESKLVDIYLVIPLQEENANNTEKYFLEFSLHKKDSWISSDAEIYGPYLVQNNEGMVFAQQYQLNSQFAPEEYEVETAVSKEGKIVTKNKFSITVGEEKLKIAAEKEPIVGKSVLQKTEKRTNNKAFFYGSGMIILLMVLVLIIGNFLSIRRFTTTRTWPISNKTLNSLEDNSDLEEKAAPLYLRESTIIRLSKEPEKATDQLDQEFGQISQQLEGLKIHEKEKMESPTPKTKTVITEPFNLKKPSLIRTAPETKTYGKIDRPSFGRRITKEYFQDLHLTDKLSRIDEEISQLNKIDWEKKKIMIGLPAAKNHGSNCPLLKRRKSEERWGKNIVTKPVSRIITKEYFENLHLTDELNRINEDISQLGKIEPEKKKVLVNLPIAKDHGQRCPLLKESKPKKNLKANIPDYKTSFKSQPKLDRELRDIQDLIGEKKNYSIKKLGPGNIITRINKQRKLK